LALVFLVVIPAGNLLLAALFSSIPPHACDKVICMRISSSKLALVLTTVLTLHLSAQQTPPPAAGNTSPVVNQAPAAQPDPDGPVRTGGPVKPPQVIYSVPPKFTEAARKARFSGNVQVYLWVDEKGNPSHVRVVHGVGMGLDEKAVESVRQFKFKPATQNGKPVKVDLYIDVNFDPF
jgi:TonB family protein